MINFLYVNPNADCPNFFFLKRLIEILKKLINKKFFLILKKLFFILFNLQKNNLNYLYLYALFYLFYSYVILPHSIVIKICLFLDVLTSHNLLHCTRTNEFK